MASTAMGFSLVLAVFVFFRVTGAAFNPNIVGYIVSQADLHPPAIR